MFLENAERLVLQTATVQLLSTAQIMEILLLKSAEMMGLALLMLIALPQETIMRLFSVLETLFAQMDYVAGSVVVQQYDLTLL